MTEDPYDLQRFVDAQAGVFDDVIAELKAGTKRTHWMWFVFPQHAGLGRSAMAARYAISSLDEARAYLAHPLLGARIREATRLVTAIENRPARDILGTPDDQKLRSSMTLFAQAAPDDPLFAAALTRFFAGRPDPATLQRLADAGAALSSSDVP